MVPLHQRFHDGDGLPQGPCPGPLRRRRGDPRPGRGGAPRILAGRRREGRVAERARARLHSRGRAQARPGVQGRPPRREGPRPAQGLRPVRVPLRRHPAEHGGRGRRPLRRGPGPAAGPDPARPRRHGRRRGESPRREGPRGPTGRPRPGHRVEPRASGTLPSVRRPGHRAPGGGLGGRSGMGRGADPRRQPRPARVRGPRQGRVQGRFDRARPRRDPPRPGAVLRLAGQGPGPQRPPPRREPAADLRDRGQRRPDLLERGVPRQLRGPGPRRHPQLSRPAPGRGPRPSGHFRIDPAPGAVRRPGSHPAAEGPPDRAHRGRQPEERPGRRLPDLPRQHGPVLPGQQPRRRRGDWPASGATSGGRRSPCRKTRRSPASGPATTSTSRRSSRRTRAACSASSCP